MSSYIEGHGYDPRPIHDCHCHIERQYPVGATIRNLQKVRDFFGLDRILILSLLESCELCRDMSANAVSLYLKEKLAPHTYAFASFSHFGDEWMSVDGCLKQAEQYREMGFDGIKMLEGKSNQWHFLGRHLNARPYESFFAYAEAESFPVLLHAGDFLSADTDLILHEVEEVLQRHPDLRLTLAHFANSVNNPQRLARLFDSYEHVTVDLALGGDFVLRFSENLPFWRDFLTHYQDRILYGTDTYNQAFQEENAEEDAAIRHTCLRSFFEDKAVFYPKQYQKQKALYGDDVIPIHPMTGLPETVLDHIYRKNFIRVFGETPRKVNRKAALAYAEKIMEGYRQELYTTHAYTELPDYFSLEEKANMARGNALAVENLETIIDYFKK